MRKCSLFLVISLLSLPMAAQKAEVFGGYQYLNIGGGNSSSGFSNSQSFNGWNASAEYNFDRLLGVEGDFGGAYATVTGVNVHVYTYTGGPVVSLPAGRIKPFAHVLFGGIGLSGSQSGVSVSWTGFTTMLGGGVDTKINRALAIRVVQFDWLYYRFGSKTIAGTPFPSFSGSNNERISTGIVLRF